MATPQDHALMVLAIKREGKFVDLEHIREKLSRDAGKEFSAEETSSLLEELAKRGLVQGREGEFAITEEGKRWFERRWRRIKEELNPDYLKVYRAKRYYPHVMDALLEFCRGRYVSVFRLFTGRAWLQRKLGPRYILIRSPRDVQRWLDVHGIDFIPYFHRVGSSRPDWLVVDFDAGKRVPLEQTKRVVQAGYEVLREFGVEPKLKFSGSRGFQLWAAFKPHDLPKDYQPRPLRTERRQRNLFTFYSDVVRFVESRVAERLPKLTTSEVAHKRAREDRVLLDPSIIKPMGDVRAPYSMHFKTGLISMPLELRELKRFKPEHADPDAVVERYAERGNEFELEPAEGEELFQAVVEWCKG